MRDSQCILASRLIAMQDRPLTASEWSPKMLVYLPETGRPSVAGSYSATLSLRRCRVTFLGELGVSMGSGKTVDLSFGQA